MAFLNEEIESSGDLTTFLGVIQELGNYTVDQLRKSLQSKVRGFTSKNLEQSIRFDVIPVGANAYRFRVYFDDYGNFIDEGVKGIGNKGLKPKTKNSKRKNYSNKVSRSRFSFKQSRKPSYKHFVLWSKIHGLNPFAVRESVWRRGLNPNHWFSEVVDENFVNNFVRVLEKAGAKQLEIDLKNILEGKVK